MTSNHSARSALRQAGFAILAGLATWLSGCASLPDDSAVVEQLDQQTGLTVLRLGHAIELYREVFRQERSERFGFLGPFETNQMGKRELFLWVAVPHEGDAAPATPSVTVDGTRLDLGDAGSTPDFAGLRATPYRIPTPWIAAYYFRIDSATVEKLGAARTVSIGVAEQSREGSTEARYTAQIGDDPRLREFAARH